MKTYMDALFAGASGVALFMVQAAWQFIRLKN